MVACDRRGDGKCIVHFPSQTHLWFGNVCLLINRAESKLVHEQEEAEQRRWNGKQRPSIPMQSPPDDCSLAHSALVSKQGAAREEE